MTTPLDRATEEFTRHGVPASVARAAAADALSAALTDPDLTHALALHQVESHGMGPSAPDGCSCGDFIIPAPYQSEYEDISSRRGRAFAAHQADAIRSAVLGGAE